MADGDRKITQGHVQVLANTVIPPSGTVRITQGHIQVLAPYIQPTLAARRIVMMVD